MNYATTIAQGVSTTQTPFFTSILAPQLKARRMPISFVHRLEELHTVPATYTLIDGEQVLAANIAVKQHLRGYLRAQRVSVALVLNRSYQQKLELLELGFTHCLDFPIATELIIRTIENGATLASPTKQTLRDTSESYQPDARLTYFHDQQGRIFLTNNTKSVYLSLQEQRILEYLLSRNGYASKNELAYAGWRHFEVKSNTITVIIRKLRIKIGKLGMSFSIQSLYGYGYSIRGKVNGSFTTTALREFLGGSSALP